MALARGSLFRSSPLALGSSQAVLSSTDDESDEENVAMPNLNQSISWQRSASEEEGQEGDSYGKRREKQQPGTEFVTVVGKRAFCGF